MLTLPEKTMGNNLDEGNGFAIEREAPVYFFPVPDADVSREATFYGSCPDGGHPWRNVIAQAHWPGPIISC